MGRSKSHEFLCQTPPSFLVYVEKIGRPGDKATQSVSTTRRDLSTHGIKALESVKKKA